MKTVYSYNPNTREFEGTKEAQESPLEPGVFLIPADTTESPPPEPKTDHAICYINNTWQHIIDNRGLWYKPDHNSEEIDEIGIKAPGDWTRTNPPLSAAEQRAAEAQAIQNEINDIENQQLTPRGAREYFIAAYAGSAGKINGYFFAKLTESDEKIAELRKNLRLLAA